MSRSKPLIENPLPILKSPILTANGLPAPWLLGERGNIAIKKAKARRHLLDFTTYTKPDYEINWHHKIICDYLERWAFGGIKRLMIFMPPGSGKSELVSRRLPAWILGKNPDIGIMATSYAASLVRDMNKDVQRIIDSDAYKELFPATKLYRRGARNTENESTIAYVKNTEMFEIVNHTGYYKCAGVGGSITGKRFFYGIIDDPLKGREFAESEVIREKLWKWYNDDFYTRRLNLDARILITLTRWHESDLAGKLLEMSRSNPKAEQWTVLKFPMVAENELDPLDPRKPGEPLWPSRFGGANEMEAIKISAGSYTWSSLYQQNPSPSGGSIFNRSWWGVPEDFDPDHKNQFYIQNPKDLESHMDIVIQSWDCTFKDTSDTDYVVGQVWGRKGPNFYLLDQVRSQMDIIATMQQIKMLTLKWTKSSAKLIEDKANGSAIITMLKQSVPGLIPIEPQGGKVVRARAVTPYIEAGNVWIPSPNNAIWIHDFLEEVASFPVGKNDDQVDAMTQALFYLSTRNNNVIVPTKIPKRIVRVGGGWTG